ncbi:MAG: DUF6754 domain-containing protein [Candidatus Cloacimonadaceae bacterium]
MNRFSLLLVFLLLMLFTTIAAEKPVSHTGKIESLEVLDAPYDDGTGIMLSWKPLPRQMRIIQYRIYRGISPDTLFFFGQVEVDPTAGVAAEKMFYYDKDYQMMLSIDSPSRLKKEKQQSAQSPLYGKIPRDPKILNRLFPYFTILGIINPSNLYKRSVKVTGADGTVSAGLRPAQFEQLAANPNPGMTYYYTVLAVNEKGTFLPYADIKSAVPVDNPPDNSSQLSTAFLTDSREFRFEWIPSAFSYDLAQWQFWLLPKALEAEFEQWQKVYSEQEGAPAPWTSKAILLAEKPNDYRNFLTLQTQDGYIVTPDSTKGVRIPVNTLQDYIPVLAAQDYSGFFAYSKGESIRFVTADQLPNKPVFTVADKPDDKGDVNTISFGLPICFITTADYVNTRHTKIRINYEISDNIKYKIEGISFQIFDTVGTLITTITEHYPDKIIHLNLKQPDPGLKTLTIKMAFRFKGEKSYTDYYVHQSLNYDIQTKRFISGDIFYKDENLSRNYYHILRKNLMQSDFYPNKKISTISRDYDDIVNFESSLDRLITGVDVKTGLLLLSPTLDFSVDEKSGQTLSVNIYRDEQLKEIKLMQDELSSLHAQLNTSPDQADSLNQAISETETYLNALLSHPVYKQSEQQKNQRRWLNLFYREQQKNQRSYAYLIMKTDTGGAYTFSDESEYYHPVSNWFNMNFLIALIASILFTIIVIYTSYQARHGKDLYLRPIAGLSEIDNAVGRATEMGRPILYVPGWSTIGEITTIASMMILNRVAKKAAEYDTRILVPNNDYYVMPLAQEMVRDAFYEAGRPDSYNPVDIFYISADQFPWAAGINGTMIREKTATNFYMGFFNAEALLMTETGNATGSIQIAGTDSITQVPFFITTCDYTLIGEEFYAASAYLSRDSELVAMLKAQDYFKFLIIFFVLLGAVLATFHFNWLTNSFPLE